MLLPNPILDATLAILSLAGAGVEHHLFRRGVLKRSWWPVLLALAVIFAAFAVVTSGDSKSGDMQASSSKDRTTR